MAIKNKLIIDTNSDVDSTITLYKKKSLFFNLMVFIINFSFPTATFVFLLISVLSLANIEVISSGDDYILFGAIATATLTLVNSLIAFFVLREKSKIYKRIYYELVLEKQLFFLKAGRYKNLFPAEEEQIYLDRFFAILNITSGQANNKEIKKEK